MPHTKVCLHYVWSTKNHVPILSKSLRNLLFDHMRKNAFEKKIHIDRLNGYTDHVHCLVWLKPTQTVAQIAKLLKAESVYWFDRQAGTRNVKLEWQDEYFVVSVSESIVPKVRRYIDNQETHHQKKSFMEEYKEFMDKYNFGDDEHSWD
ncbi:MAG: IS200/IS605 family transposase [Bacteroidota bacterium]